MSGRKELTEKEMDLIEEAAMLRAEGKSWKEAADEVQIEAERLRKLVRRSGRAYWALFEEAQERASMEAAARARATLTKLLNSQDERVALRAAQTLMADDRGRKKNAVLAEKNDIFAGNMEKKRKNSEAWAQLRDAEMTLAACRRAENRNRNRRCTQMDADLGSDREEMEPSLWQQAYDGQYGGGGNGGGRTQSPTRHSRYGDGARTQRTQRDELRPRVEAADPAENPRRGQA